MAGAKGRSGGANRRPAAEHVLSGTYRASRHGPLPAHVHPIPDATAEEGSWQPLPADLEHMTAAGRRFVRGWLKRYEVSAMEGAVLLEAGHMRDRLTALRAMDRTTMGGSERARWTRLEIAASKLLAALLAQLRVSR